jgi:hypothetical protein
MTIDVHPWTVAIREDSVVSKQHETLIYEAMMQPRSTDGLPIDDTRSLHLRQYPNLKEFVEETLIPKIMQYAWDQFNYEPLLDSWTGWVRNSSDGCGTPIHHHSGAHVSAIYYLEAREGYLTLFDPRGLASRGYPTDVINNHFQPYKYKTEHGGLVIFPSYLQHSVENHEPGLRLAIPIDVYLKE